VATTRSSNSDGSGRLRWLSTPRGDSCMASQHASSQRKGASSADEGQWSWEANWSH
jgi:hypothetical protein